MRSTLVFTALAAALALGGCASPVPVKQAPVESKAPTAVGSGTAGANANGAGQNQVAAVQAPAESNAGVGPGSDVPKSVYFGFNSYTVDSQYTPVLNVNATYLTQHPQAHVQLQGNTDARGSREYNLALGQKRADAVMKGMELLGVKPTQMEAISFGKEKPKAQGTSEADYAENRRVDIVYQR